MQPDSANQYTGEQRFLQAVACRNKIFMWQEKELEKQPMLVYNRLIQNKAMM